MSVDRFGKPVPIHFDILALAGWHVDVDASYVIPGDVERLAEMRRGRAELVRQTGLDFGYDLAAWRKHLIGREDDDLGYCHDYAFHVVDHAVCEAIHDPTFRRLRALLEAQERPDESAGNSQPPQRTGAAGIVGGIRKWFGRGPSR